MKSVGKICTVFDYQLTFGKRGLVPTIDIEYFPVGTKVYTLPGVDTLAQQIQVIDGNNNLSAGILAEKLIEWMETR
jgi:hypothetical protein